MATVPTSRCLKCGSELDQTTLVAGRGAQLPKPNDLTVCFNCGHVMCFDQALKLRSLTDSELIDIANDSTVDLVVNAIKNRRKN